MDLDQQVDELYEMWVNGNLADVVGVLTRGTSRPDVTTCVALAVKLSAKMSERERAVLLRILKDKM